MCNLPIRGSILTRVKNPHNHHRNRAVIKVEESLNQAECLIVGRRLWHDRTGYRMHPGLRPISHQRTEQKESEIVKREFGQIVTIDQRNRVTSVARHWTETLLESERQTAISF